MMDADALGELELLEDNLTGWNRFQALRREKKTVFDSGRIGSAHFNKPVFAKLFDENAQ